MEITGDISELLEATKGLEVADKALARANVSAINKTAVSTRAFAVKKVSQEYRLTQKRVRSELKISRATPWRQEAKIHGSGAPGIPLFEFAPTPKRVPSTLRLKSGGYSPKRGIKVMVRKGSRKIVEGAFIAQMRSGHVGVFQRRMETGEKLPIKELYGPSPIRILDSDRYAIPIDDFAAATLDKNLAHEVNYFFKKFGVIPQNARFA